MRSCNTKWQIQGGREVKSGGDIPGVPPLSVLYTVKLTLCMCYLIKHSILERIELELARSPPLCVSLSYLDFGENRTIWLT